MSIEFTEAERKIAQNIMEEKDILNFLAKVFLETEDKIDREYVTTKNDAELGQIVRADVLAEEKVKLRFNRIKRLGQPTGQKSRTGASE